MHSLPKIVIKLKIGKIMDIKSFLGNVCIFNNLTENELEKIKNITTFLELKTGEKLFSENDDSNALFVMKTGCVMVKKGNVVLSVINEGECIGEITFLTREKRTASVIAVENSFILKINYDDLDSLLNNEPSISAKIYKSIALTLSKRLADISQSLEKRFQPTKFI